MSARNKLAPEAAVMSNETTESGNDILPIEGTDLGMLMEHCEQAEAVIEMVCDQILNFGGHTDWVQALGGAQVIIDKIHRDLERLLSDGGSGGGPRKQPGLV